MDRSDARLPRGKGAAVTRRHVLAVAGGLLVGASRRGLAATAAAPDMTEKRIGVMEIKRSGSRPSGKGPEAWFTGAVRVDPLFQVGDPARINGGHVTFEPGARTMWHTHRSARP